MKKAFYVSLILLVTACSNKMKIDVEMVWSNYLKNFGDTAKINNVKTIQYTCEFTHDGKPSGTGEVILKDNSKIYISFKSPKMEVITKYDGRNFVRVVNNKRTEVSKIDQLDLMMGSDFFHELHYKEHGFKTELVGMETIDNKEVYKIKYFSDDIINYYYINALDYKLVKIKKNDYEIWLIEIKEIEGIPYFSKSKSVDSYGTGTSTINSIKINVEVNDSIFK